MPHIGLNLGIPRPFARLERLNAAKFGGHSSSARSATLNIEVGSFCRNVGDKKRALEVRFRIRVALQRTLS